MRCTLEVEGTLPFTPQKVYVFPQFDMSILFSLCTSMGNHATYCTVNTCCFLASYNFWAPKNHVYDVVLKQLCKQHIKCVLNFPSMTNVIKLQTDYPNILSMQQGRFRGVKEAQLLAPSQDQHTSFELDELNLLTCELYFTGGAKW